MNDTPVKDAAYWKGLFQQHERELDALRTELSALRLCVANVSTLDNALLAVEARRDTARLVEKESLCRQLYEVKIAHAKTIRLLADERLKNVMLRAVLERLRDCDWVISLPDRMDAVRAIAREALEATP